MYKRIERTWSKPKKKRIFSNQYNINDDAEMTYDPSEIIAHPEHYKSQTPAIYYWLILSLGNDLSMDKEIILFLLSDSWDKSYNDGHHIKCMLTFAELTTILLSQMSLKKRNREKVKEIAHIFLNTILFKISLEQIHQCSDHWHTLYNFYQSAASNQMPEPIYNEGNLREIKQDFFIRLMVYNKDFCLLITTNPYFNFLISQYIFTLSLPKNIPLLMNFFDTISQIPLTENDFNKQLKNQLKMLLIIYINVNIKIPKLLFNHPFFWELLSQYTREDKALLLDTIIQNKLSNIVLFKIRREIKQDNRKNIKKIIALIKDDFLHRLLEHSRPTVRTKALKTLVQLKDPLVDAEVCRYQIQLKRLGEWWNMIERLRAWFDYDNIIASPEMKRAFASSQDLIDAYRGKLATHSQFLFLSSNYAEKLKIMADVKALNKKQRHWVSAHRAIANIIIQKFKDNIEKYLSNIFEIYQQYKKVFFLKLILQDPDRFDPNLYVLGRFPEAMQIILTDAIHEIQEINQQLTRMKKMWQAMSTLRIESEKRLEDKPIRGFIPLRDFFNQIFDVYTHELDPKDKYKVKKQFFIILAEVLTEMFPEVFQVNEQEKPASQELHYINKKMTGKLTILLKDNGVFQQKSTALQKEKLKICFQHMP